jgi:hypothetical protein
MLDHPVLTNLKPSFNEFKKDRNKASKSQPNLPSILIDFVNNSQILETLGAPHLDSFNHFLTNGIQTVLKSIKPFEFELSNGDKLKVFIEECNVSPPRISQQIDVKERKIFPSDLGPVPIMIRVS